MPDEPILTPEEGTDPAQPEPVTPPVQPPVEPTVPPIDYEKKFAESTRENQILSAKLAEQERIRQESTKEPTDSELRQAFPEWDTLSDFEKRMARDNFDAKRIAVRADQTARQLQDERARNTSIELAVSSDPALQGKEREFTQFASKPQYKNVPMDVLISAFLQKNGGAPVATPPPTPRPGLEPGNGGPRTPEKPKQLSADDLALLRKTNEKAYMEYVKTHDIKVDELE